MSTLVGRLKNIIDENNSGYWEKRIYFELQYAIKVSEVNDNRFDILINKAIDYLTCKKNEVGMVNKEICTSVENLLVDISNEAKKYKMVCAAHAHIDMNWMWRWDETVSVVLDTFRTMLNLMNEYPDFKFSQSQAVVYRIMEDYAPEMLKEVKKRIGEERWEVTASSWVECDKNIPNGESLARQILYSKEYLSELLDINPESLKIDFEPDTFGHSVNIPEILSKGGVKYYYHCRGYEGYNIYRWIAPSGKSVIAYHEPFCYNSDIHPSMVLFVPKLCKDYNLATVLKVYGVGDHGGGPTRRDIERIIDMNTWPIFPNIKFGTFNEYFNYLENSNVELPEVKGELNFVFSGCYSSQARIKAGNRICEAALDESEAFSALSSIYLGTKYPNSSFSGAWKNVLFNQFHDILPGSGKIDTREYAMGLYQNTLAVANSEKSLVLKNIGNMIDTSAYTNNEEDIKETTSEGAGVGFGVDKFKISQYEGGKGKTRIFTVFNSSVFNRKENIEIISWDWSGDLEAITFKDSNGKSVPHMLLENGLNYYWGHSYLKALIKVDVPACGYSTYVMNESDDKSIESPVLEFPRTENIDSYIIENSKIKVVFDKRNASIMSFYDKLNNEEMIDTSKPAGNFRLIEEDTDKHMSAWLIGRYMNVINLNQNVKIKQVNYPKNNNVLKQAISYEIPFKNSLLKVIVSLEDNSNQLKYHVECNWLEIGKDGICIPQLNFNLPLSYPVRSYRYDVPFGTISREAIDMDVPANSWAVAERKTKSSSSLMLVTDTKNGFRGFDNSIALTLIRSSFDPDPYPEVGTHDFSFAISLVNGSSNKNMIDNANIYNHPLSVVSDKSHKGILKPVDSFAELKEGTVVVSSMKITEAKDQNKLVLRVYETEGNKTTAVIKFGKVPIAIYYIDINENKIECDLNTEICGETVKFSVDPNSIANVCIEF